MNALPTWMKLYAAGTALFGAFYLGIVVATPNQKRDVMTWLFDLTMLLQVVAGSALIFLLILGR